jgi:teichuronic acid biosynthesis glycosyltransferase TuaG
MKVRTARVGVVIPCYQCAETIERAVNSVMAQTMRPAEMWLVDDASPDQNRTLEALHALKRRYAPRVRIEVLSLASNGGPSAARNAGWSASEQSYIAFLDADDAWHPNKLELQYCWMKDHPDVALTGHPRVRPVSGQFDVPLPTEWSAHPINSWCLLLSNPLSTSSILLRRELAFRFEPTKRRSEDFLLWAQIVLDGHLAWRLELPLAYVFKEAYGEAGLSSELWKMELGELDTYTRLVYQRRLNPLILFGIVPFSLFKFGRRLLRDWGRRNSAQ